MKRARFASDAGLVARLGLTRSSYEGPTGIVCVLHAACQDAGLPSASLWAAVPHYIAAAPNPKAALAIVRKLEGLVAVAHPNLHGRGQAGEQRRLADLDIYVGVAVLAARRGAHFVQSPRKITSHSRRTRFPMELEAGLGTLYHSISSTLPQRSQIKW